MADIQVRQAKTEDIPIIESILFDTVSWLNAMAQPLWKAEDVVWAALSKAHIIDDFYLAFIGGIPAGCMAVLDIDPFFWPDVAKGDSLFIHKLAVTKNARKTGAADALIGYAKELGRQREVSSIRLDCHGLRTKLRAFYEKHGFVCVEDKVCKDTYNVPEYYAAFYIYWMNRYPDNDTAD